MAGDYPAMHWWPTIVAAWAVTLTIAGLALRLSREKNRTLARVGVEIFAAITFALAAGAIILLISNWLGFLGMGLVAVIGCLASIPLLRGPDLARWAARAIHAGLLLSLLASHVYFSGVQGREGKLHYGLQHGTGPEALKPMLRAMPLAELLQLTEKPLHEERSGRVLSEIVEERTMDLYHLEESELVTLAQGAMSPELKKRIQGLLEQKQRNKAQRS